MQKQKRRRKKEQPEMRYTAKDVGGIQSFKEEEGVEVKPWQRRQEIKEKDSLFAEGGSRFWLALSFFGLLLLLIYPPFFRGLFFPVEQRWTLLLTAFLFLTCWLWKLSRRDLSFLSQPLDYLAAAFLLSYIVSAVSPASRSLALSEIVKVLLYFLVFWLTGQVGQNSPRRIWLIHALYFSGLGVAFMALLTATNLVYVKDSFVGGRFYSTLQYPNALASYVVAASIFGFFLWSRSPSPWRFFYAAGNYLLLMVFLGTGSRGGYLMYPLILLFFLVLVPSGYRAGIFGHTLVTWAAAIFGNMRFIPLALTKAYLPAWRWFLLGLLAALAGQALLWAAGRLLRQPRLRVAAAVTALFLVFAGAGYYLHKLQPALPATTQGESGFWQRMLPPQVVQRLQRISLEERSSRERILWTQDALTMLKDHPLFGLGGGGWEAAYRAYQRYYYNSTQVHNFYAQVGVETGFLGLAILASLWMAYLLLSWNNYRRTGGQERLQALSLTAAALSLGLHAAIDFDLSLGAVSIFLWSCFGLSRGLHRQLKKEGIPAPPHIFHRLKLPYLAGVCLSVALIFLLAGSYILGVKYARAGQAALAKGDGKEAVAAFSRALRYDPFNADYAATLSSLYLRLGREKEAVRLAEDVVKREPYNYQYAARLAEAYWRSGRIEEALGTLEKARQKAPWLIASWENLAQVYVLCGLDYLQLKKNQDARNVFARVHKLPEEMQKQIAQLEPEIKTIAKDGGLHLSSPLRVNIGIAQYFLGLWKEAEENLALAARDKNTQAEALLWQALLAQKQGRPGEASKLLDQVKKANSRLAQQFDWLKSLPILTGEKS
ncbi:MAG: hypothetical protein PWP65_1348 [Clostridia bacterium]|nr:hypothetical protein [Clostridia bacterium]